MCRALSRVMRVNRDLPTAEKMEQRMRQALFAIAMAVIGFLAIPASAAPVSGGDVRSATPVQGLLEHVQSGRYCARLRRACMHKEERGEVGEGNCRRYRQECGRSR